MTGLLSHIRSSLALRQTLWVLILAICMGLGTSCIRTVFDYYSEQRALENQIAQLFTISEASAAQSLYYQDKALAQRTAEGLTGLPIIGMVRLVDDFGLVLIEKEKNKTEDFFRPFVRFMPHPHRFRHPLVFRPSHTAVGYIEIEIDPHPLLSGLFRRSAMNLLMELAQYLSMALILSYIFYRNLTRPLLEMAREITLIHPSKPEDKRITIPEKHQKNEMGHLALTINEILSRLQTLNQDLEQRVEERTAALNEEREQLLSIFDSIDEAIYVTDPSTHRLLFVNQAFKKLWGDATGQVCHHIIHRNPQPCTHCTGIHMSQGTEKNGFPHEFFQANSQNWFRCFSRNIRWPDGRIVRYEMAFDITVQREAETALRERSAELEKINRELKESIEALENTREQLVQSEKMASLGSLVAGVSHEINTPVGNSVTASSFLAERTRHIRGLFSQGILRQSDFTAYLQNAEEATGIIQTNLSRAADLISSFKKVSVDQTCNQPRLFRLKEYMEDTLFSLKPRLRGLPHRVSLQCPEDLELFQDPGAISQIVTNLILNSLSHAFRETQTGEMHFDIRATDDMLDFIYRDNGSGASAHTLKHIFDPFYTTSRKEGGTGLGMHIVYNLVTQTLQGNISCESPKEGGIRFHLVFPRILTAHAPLLPGLRPLSTHPLRQ